MGTKTLFTIVIPCNQEEDLLIDTLSTLANQSFGEFEVILVDAHTSDEVLDKARKMMQGRLRVYTMMYYHYYSMLNKGAKLARGKYVLFFRPGNLMTTLYAFDNLKKVIMASNEPEVLLSAAVAFDENLEQRAIIQPPLSKKKLMAGVLQTPLASRAFRRDYFLEIRGFNEAYWVRSGYDIACRYALDPKARVVGIGRVINEHHTAFEIDAKYVGFHAETLKIIYKHFGLKCVFSYLLTINVLSFFRAGRENVGFVGSEQSFIEA
jgi:hypothetical protein